MTQEMGALTLIQGLGLSYTMPTIAFDKDALKEQVTAILQDYDGRVVQFSEYETMKSELAGLNTLAKSLDDKRKLVVGEIGAPLKQFEKDVNEIRDLVLRVRSAIDLQVKAFDKKERDSRRAAVQFVIDGMLEEFCLKDFHIEIADKWLNKSQKAADTRSAIERLIKEELKTRKNALILAEAKAVRGAYVDSIVKQLIAQFGFGIPVHKIAVYLDINIKSEDVQPQIVELFEAEHEHRVLANKEREAREKASQQKESGNLARPASTTSKHTRKYKHVVAFEFEGKHVDRMRELMEEMKSLCTSFKFDA